MYADEVVICENLNCGFVTKVEVRNAATDAFETVWQGTDTSTSNALASFHVPFTARTYLVHAVRITIDINHVLGDWEEIDAVQHRGLAWSTR